MFENYKNIYYPFTDSDGEVFYKVVKDITENLKIRQDAIDVIELFEYYNLRDNETPEIVASKYYNDPKLHYLVLLANQRYDWRNDFPLTTQQLREYVNESYANPHGIHHFEDVDGNIVSHYVGSDGLMHFVNGKQVEVELYDEKNSTTI